MSEVPNDNINTFQDNVKSFLDANVAYYKLWLFRAIAKSSSSLMSMVLIMLLCMSVIFFFSISAAIGIGYALDNFAYGFLIIGFVYLLITIIVYLRKDKFFEHQVIKKFSDFF